MDIYSYFSITWQHLKEFFQINSIKQNQNSTNKMEVEEEFVKIKSVAEPPSLLLNSGTQFSSQTLRLILKKTKIDSLFEKSISDHRRPFPIKYSVSSLLMHALLTLLLRQRSKHAFYDKAFLSPYLGQNIANLCRAPCVPNPKTIEDFLLKMNGEELESILPQLFRFLLRGKFFQLHSEFKVKGGNDEKERFWFGIDAEITHTYHEPNQHPTASCSYCLKRTRGKKSWYVHCDVSLCLIGEGLVFPLFLYRVKTNHSWETESDEKLKQQCELSALPHLLEKFRNFFPKLPAGLLLDSLYAQGTAMQLCEQFKLGYMIVRKAGSLKSLNSNIEGLKKLQSPKNRQFTEGRWHKEQTAYLFSDLSHREHSFTLIDLKEMCTKLPSKRFAKRTEKSSHWQWITNLAVKVDEVFYVAHKGRLRWNQEDFFNTLMNRGFNLRHDFSRSPRSQTAWRLLMFIAFALSTLMQLSLIGHLSRKGCAFINWIEILVGELCHLPPDILEKDPLPKQLRFWFDTS